MGNLKILVIMVAAVCGSIMNPTPSGQILSVMLEKAFAARNQNDPLIAQNPASDGEKLLPLHRPAELRLTD